MKGSKFDEDRSTNRGSLGLHLDGTQDLNRQVVRLLATVEGQPVPEPLASAASATVPMTAAEVISAQLVEFGRWVFLIHNSGDSVPSFSRAP